MDGQKGDDMTDLDTYVADLLAHEGCPAEPTGCYPYLDTKGLVTFGVGEHLSIVAFLGVPWVVPNMPLGSPYVFRPGIESEVVAAYNELLNEGQNRVFPFPASHYAQFTRIRLPKAVALQRCKDRLMGEFLPHIRTQVDYARHATQDPMFDDLPSGAKRVLVDLCWNLGYGGFTVDEWPSLFEAIAADNYDEASRQCITVNKGETHEDAAKRPRNVWRRDLMLSCAGPVKS
jgi:GH24 family phage-related lysozyme (muramidase)